MSISVIQRSSEIGIRRAVGHSRSKIGAQFLLESLFVGVLGGLLGAALGSGGRLRLGVRALGGGDRLRPDPDLDGPGPVGLRHRRALSRRSRRPASSRWKRCAWADATDRLSLPRLDPRPWPHSRPRSKRPPPRGCRSVRWRRRSCPPRSARSHRRCCRSRPTGRRRHRQNSRHSLPLLHRLLHRLPLRLPLPLAHSHRLPHAPAPPALAVPAPVLPVLPLAPTPVLPPPPPPPDAWLAGPRAARARIARTGVGHARVTGTRAARRRVPGRARGTRGRSPAPSGWTRPHPRSCSLRPTATPSDAKASPTATSTTMARATGLVLRPPLLGGRSGLARGPLRLCRRRRAQSLPAHTTSQPSFRLVGVAIIDRRDRRQELPAGVT